MKLITLNTHSLEEPDYAEKKLAFAEVLKKEQPDILALQEVNQSVDAAPVSDEMLRGFTRCPGFQLPVRADNHALALAQMLEAEGIFYHWTWISAKLGYGKYDEGMAIFSKKPIAQARQYLISQTDDYQNWKTRRTLGIRTENAREWFFTVHMGWWKDEEEPFFRQWKKLEGSFHQDEIDRDKIWLMGDFNSPCDVSGEGYQLVCESGWKDTYVLAEKKDSGMTVEKQIDGWRDSEPKKMRLDYIFCNKEIQIKDSSVICDGRTYPVVSDHYGVMISDGR